MQNIQLPVDSLEFERDQMARMNILGADKKGGALAVAVENNKASQYALKWAVDSVVLKGQAITLVHVRQPDPAVAHSDVSENSGRAFGQRLENEAKDLFVSFRVFCQRKNVQCSEFMLEDADIAKALVEFAAKNAIEVMVLGAPSRSGLVRRFRTNDIPSLVCKGAPHFCSVYIISKGKISSMRSATAALPTHCILNQWHHQNGASLDRLDAKSRRNHHHVAPEKMAYPSRQTPDEMEIKSPFTRGGRSSFGKSYELSAMDSDISFVSSGRPCAEQMFRSFSDNSEMTPNRLPNGSAFDAMSFGSSSFSDNKSMDMPHFYSSSNGNAGASSSYWSAHNTDDVEAEMRRLRLELKQTMDMYSSACKEAITAKQKAVDLQRWKSEEQRKTENARLSEQSDLEFAENERSKGRAFLDAAEASHRRAAQESEHRNKESFAYSDQQLRYRRYTVEQIEEATDHFNPSRKIGEGGYGPVYKGHLDHTPVAIKVLRTDAAQGWLQFQQEVEVLSCIRHPNMVLLLGACPESGCLVYEHMVNGSLDDRLFRRGNTPVLSWQMRFRIAAEIGTGLLFLHQTKPEPIVHRDLKPGNILLDRNYVSKISDVGLARLVPASVADGVTQYHMTSTAGTFCYIDPEYQQTGMLGTKSDIYSFGVMLLQIITAKPPMGLTHHVQRSIERGTFSEMLDPAVADWPVEEALKFAKLALECAELRRKDRPDLGKVVLTELDRLRAFAEESEINNFSAMLDCGMGSSAHASSAAQEVISDPQLSGYSSSKSR